MHSSMVPANAVCPTCGFPVTAETEGLCPACLLGLALSPQAEPLPRAFGRYQLIEQLGRGGDGVVFRAFDPVADRMVALKILKDGELASPEDVDRFQSGARKQAALQYEGIVPVYDVGTDQGRAYFTMQMIEGGTLANRMDSFQGNPRDAAQMVALIARAVHHAHQRFVLHRDLKPANILLDPTGRRPHIADFGLARRLDADSVSEADHLAGTAPYMTPEQISTPKDLTVAVDVYGLGAVLYELLTGRPPATGATVAEILKNVIETDPPAPRQLLGAKAIDVDLETICMKCLRKGAGERYASAMGVAMDLERYLGDDPIAARPPSRAERVGRAVRHHPVASMFAVIVLALLFAMVAAAISVARTQENEVRGEVLKVNAYAARALSGAVLFELRGLADEVTRAAADEAMMEILRDPSNAKATATAIAKWQAQPLPGRFDSLLLLDAQGRWLARNPLVPTGDFPGEYFDWRDYFIGGSRLGRTGQRGVYVSRAYTSVADGTTRFGLTTPVYDAKGKWVGLLGGAVHSATALGGLILKDPGEPNRIAAVVARRDRDRKSDALPDDWLVLVHHDVQRGSRHLMNDRAALAAMTADPEEALGPTARATVTDDDHRDPIPSFEGRWLAGVAPVGGTPFAVIVQTRYDAAVGTNQRLASRLRTAGAGTLAVALFVCVGVLGLVRRRRRL